MADHPHAAMYRESFDAMGGGDFSALGDRLADDVRWHLAIDEPPLQGKDAVLGALASDVEGVEFTLDLHDVLANDGHMVALIRVSASRGADSIDYRAVEIMHVADGKVTERWAMVDDPAAVGAFFRG